jgi:hypothetical protein
MSEIKEKVEKCRDKRKKIIERMLYSWLQKKTGM